jgi:glutathione peroxidase
MRAEQVLISLTLMAAAAVAQAQGAAPASPAPAAVGSKSGAACPALLQHSFLRLQDEKPQAMCQYSGKVLLIVNTASFCGFTGQYADLEALHARYASRGLVVLGFPSNDFSQEGGSNKEIADFCENTFSVKFPMFAKSSVTGRGANALFKQLANQTGQSPRWNFYKYLVSRDGQSVTVHGSTINPQDPRFVKALEQLLAK